MAQSANSVQRTYGVVSSLNKSSNVRLVASSSPAFATTITEVTVSSTWAESRWASEHPDNRRKDGELRQRETWLPIAPSPGPPGRRRTAEVQPDTLDNDAESHGLLTLLESMR